MKYYASGEPEKHTGIVFIKIHKATTTVFSNRLCFSFWLLPELLYPQVIYKKESVKQHRT